MATTTRIKGSIPSIGRELTVHVFEPEREDIEDGEKWVYLAIEDHEGDLLGNLNVPLNELMSAIGAVYPAYAAG